MIDPISYWTSIIGGLTAFVIVLLKTIEILEKLMNRPNAFLKLLEFLIYGSSLVVPNMGIGYFFYLVGTSPNLLSETKFFWIIIAQLTTGVSIYTYIWGRWIYPRLHRIMGSTDSRLGSKPNSRKNTDSFGEGGKR